MSDSTRRRLLAATGALGVGAVAGCLGDGDGDGDGDRDGNGDGAGTGAGDDTEFGIPDDQSDGTDDHASDSAGAEGTILGDITVDNLDDEKRTVHVMVDIDGQIETWAMETLEAREGGVTLDREWPTDGSQFRVIVRLEEDDVIREATPADWNEPDCVSLSIVVRDAGTLSIAGDTTDTYCED